MSRNGGETSFLVEVITTGCKEREEAKSVGSPSC